MFQMWQERANVPVMSVIKSKSTGKSESKLQPRTSPRTSRGTGTSKGDEQNVEPDDGENPSV